MGRPKPSVAETSYSPQSLPDSHIIVQLGPPRGSSQFISTDPEQTERLVELSQRLKRSGMLAQRGDFGVVNLYAVDPKAEAGGKAKGVEGEVVCVWTEKEVRAFRRGGEWPRGFGKRTPTPPPSASQSESEDGEDGADSDGDFSDNAP